jgi:hypothetical protein
MKLVMEQNHIQAPWVQVSRLGMPLTNEVIVPIGYKDLWNSLTPYQDQDYKNILQMISITLIGPVYG